MPENGPGGPFLSVSEQRARFPGADMQQAEVAPGPRKPVPVWRRASAAAGFLARLPVPLGLCRVLREMDVVVHLLHPVRRDEVVLAVGAVVLGQLDGLALDAVNDADL